MTTIDPTDDALEAAAPTGAAPPDRRRVPRPGTAAAALAHRDFRVVWVGALGSNVGTWMQNAVLGAYGYDLTRSATFVAMLYLAQLGPQFVLAVPGGAIVDRYDRRRVLLATQVLQMVFSFALVGAVGMSGDARKLALIGCVAVIGVSNTLFMPGWSALIAQLVGPRDLPGAVSLGFVQLNLSRVIGPFIGVVLYAHFGAGVVFGINGVSYLAAIAALWVVRPAPVLARASASIMQRMREGLSAVAGDEVLRWVLRTIAGFSFFSLAFISLLPAIADRLYGVESKSSAYAVLFACFGAGSAVGAVAVGTVLAGRPLVALTRQGLVVFAGFLTLFAVLSHRAFAYPVVFGVGVSYFVAATALSTALQQRVSDEMRARVLSLWFMCFGGTVPIGAAVMSQIGDHVGLRVMLGVGAAAAAVLALAPSPSGAIRRATA